MLHVLYVKCSGFIGQQAQKYGAMLLPLFAACDYVIRKKTPRYTFWMFGCLSDYKVAGDSFEGMTRT